MSFSLSNSQKSKIANGAAAKSNAEEYEMREYERMKKLQMKKELREILERIKLGIENIPREQEEREKEEEFIVSSQFKTQLLSPISTSSNNKMKNNSDDDESDFTASSTVKDRMSMEVESPIEDDGFNFEEDEEDLKYYRRCEDDSAYLRYADNGIIHHKAIQSNGLHS